MRAFSLAQIAACAGLAVAVGAGVPTVRIADGVDMPLLGFGTGTFDEPPVNTYNAVVDALKAGYRMM